MIQSFSAILIEKQRAVGALRSTKTRATARGVARRQDCVEKRIAEADSEPIHRHVALPDSLTLREKTSHKTAIRKTIFWFEGL